MPKLFPPGYWPEGYVDGALSGDEGGAAFRNASATIMAGGTVTATATVTSDEPAFADASATIMAAGTVSAAASVSQPQAPSAGGRRRRRNPVAYWPAFKIEQPGVQVDAAAKLIAGSTVLVKISATGAASARINAGAEATGGAELAVRQDYTETDNAFWAMAA